MLWLEGGEGEEEGGEVLLQGKEENPLSLSKLLWSFFPTRELLWLPTRTDRVRKLVRAVLAAN